MSFYSTLFTWCCWATNATNGCRCLEETIEREQFGWSFCWSWAQGGSSNESTVAWWLAEPNCYVAWSAWPGDLVRWLGSHFGGQCPGVSIRKSSRFWFNDHKETAINFDAPDSEFIKSDDLSYGLKRQLRSLERKLHTGQTVSGSEIGRVHRTKLMSSRRRFHTRFRMAKLSDLYKEGNRLIDTSFAGATAEQTRMCTEL